MLKRIFIYIFLLLSAQQICGQDIHFSNFYSNTLNVNPAFTGYFRGKSRMNVTYRDQYRTVAIPFQTVSLGYDTKIKNHFGFFQSIGWGFLINYDLVGDAQFNTTQINIPFSKLFTSYNKKWYYSIGLMPAVYFNSLEYTYLKFPEQFDGIQYNPDIIPSENMEQKSLGFFNMSGGMLTTFKQNKLYSYTIGVAGYNLNNPNMSFFNDSKVHLKPRLLIHGMAMVELNTHLDIVPAYKIQFQGTQKEYHFGAMAIKYFDKITISNLSTGIWFRSREKDAVIVGLGMQYFGYDILFNYDINISTLRYASMGHGAFEVTVSNIQFPQKKKRKMASVKCPPYM